MVVFGLALMLMNSAAGTSDVFRYVYKFLMMTGRVL